MARTAKVLTTENFPFSGIVVSKKGRGKSTSFQFVDANGNELDRKTAQRREYSAKYRSDNPDAAKQSSREYASRVRADAKAWRDEHELIDEADEEFEDDESVELDEEPLEDVS